MFGDETRRRVNLGGRSAAAAASSRSALLEQSRKERQQRSQLKLQHTAATTIQSHYRAHKHRQRSKHALRQHFDAHLPTVSASVTTGDASAFAALHQLLRSTVYFRNESMDAKRWSDLKSLLVLALRSKSVTVHYGAAIAVSRSEARSGYIHTLTRLIALLLADLNDIATVNESCAASSAFLLFNLTNVSAWPEAGGHRDEYRQLIHTVLSRVVLWQPSPSQSPYRRQWQHNPLQCSWHRACRARLLNLTAAVNITATESMVNASPAIKNTVGLISFLALLPIELSSQLGSTPLPFAQSFVGHFLTVPLLTQRLKALGLAAISQRIFAPNIAFAASRMSLIDSDTAQSFVSSLPSTLSFTSFDSEPRSATPMDISDDSDGSDKDSESEFEVRSHHTINADQATLTAASLWLAANMLDANDSVDSAKSNNNDFLQSFFHSLDVLFNATPAPHFPSSSRHRHHHCHPHYYHPALAASLDSMLNRSFINRIIMSIEHSQSFNQLSRVSSLVDCLLSKWRNGESLLSAIAFAPSICRSLFQSLESSGAIQAQLTAKNDFTASTNAGNVDAILELLCATLGHVLPITGDSEFFGDDTQSSQSQSVDRGSPLPLKSLDRLVSFLVAASYRIFWLHVINDSRHARLRSRISNVLTLLRDRQARRPFSSSSVWMMTQLPFAAIEAELREFESNPESRRSNRASRLFSALPFVFLFESRLEYFYSRIEAEKAQLEPTIDFAAGRGVKARIRRTHLLEDGYAALHLLGTKLKGRVSIEFIDAHGVLESGLDGGGLFREFAGDLIRVAVDPAHALFICTEQGEVAPNPDSLSLCHDEESRQMVLSYYEFIGQMIGKVIFEKLTIGLGGAHQTSNSPQSQQSQREPQFALFFLRKLLGHVANIDDLYSFDPALYRGLLSITKLSETELRSLRLTFTADRRTSNSLLEFESVPLIPNGANIEVDNENVRRYFHLTADWRLNRSIHRQCQAFARGLHAVIPKYWLTVFAADELRVLISGAESIDLNDLKSNTVYASGYSATHPCVQWFWSELQSWPHADQAALLRFVTSVPRAPLTGFQSLNPKFCIQRTDVDGRGEQTLPTSATCMNLLRLPRYSSRHQLRDRLLYAVRNGLGFGLT